MTKLKLFFSPGACSRVAMTLLEASGAEYETELIVFKRGDHRRPEFLERNPSGKIPVIEHNGSCLTQNVAILTYLDEIFPEANFLGPAGTPIERARQLSELAKFSADLHPLVTRIRIPQFFCDIDGSEPRVKEMAEAAMSFQLADYDRRLSKTEWLGGDHWNVLDIYLHWVWFRITGAGFDGTPFPSIENHYAQTLLLPPVKAALKIENEAQDWLNENGWSIDFSKMQKNETRG